MLPKEEINMGPMDFPLISGASYSPDYKAMYVDNNEIHFSNSISYLENIDASNAKLDQNLDMDDNNINNVSNLSEMMI